MSFGEMICVYGNNKALSSPCGAVLAPVGSPRKNSSTSCSVRFRNFLWTRKNLVYTIADLLCLENRKWIVHSYFGVAILDCSENDDYHQQSSHYPCGNQSDLPTSGYRPIILHPFNNITQFSVFGKRLPRRTKTAWPSWSWLTGIGATLGIFTLLVAIYVGGRGMH